MALFELKPFDVQDGFCTLPDFQRVYLPDTFSISGCPNVKTFFIVIAWFENVGFHDYNEYFSRTDLISDNSYP